MIPNPKFNSFVKDQIISREGSTNTGRMGVIQSFDQTTNTATVLLSRQHSNTMGDLITKVPCPTFMGLQLVAPEPGRPCWVVFQGTQNEKNAIVSHYFNHAFRSYEYGRQYSARTGVPLFTLGI